MRGHSGQSALFVTDPFGLKAGTKSLLASAACRTLAVRRLIRAIDGVEARFACKVA
ncbi:hypothetical protein ACFOM8_16485 [Paracoccus angustae]|uniref:Uncharacterized protein n=1 Tax=Paracoccus angustae TaxID=1671480 RepID=A0ABV7U830_9RHOB